MRTRLSLSFVPIALLMALILPTSVLASGSYGYIVLKGVCSTSGGAYGYGRNVLKIEMYENGQSGIYYFRAHAYEQEYFAGSWSSIHDFGWTNHGWGGTDGPASHTWDFGRRYNLAASDTGRPHRMLFKLQFGNGTAYPYTKKVVGHAC